MKYILLHVFPGCPFGDTKYIAYTTYKYYTAIDMSVEITCEGLVNSFGLAEVCEGVNRKRNFPCCETCDRLRNTSRPGEL